MNWQRFSLPIRIAIALGVGYAMMRFLFAGTNGHVDAGGQVMAVVLAAVYGVILFLLFGFDVLRGFAERLMRIYEPHDRNFRIMPEYSVAQARLKEGRYAEAVAEYLKVVEQFPQDIHAHLQIAEIAAEKLNNFGLAELELQSAFAKATSSDAIAMTAHRLSDFYLQKLQRPAQAIDALEQLRARLPDTKQALDAQQRIAILRDLAGREQPPAPPKKIAFRATDDETLRRRRGY
jgi:tetratricopeptide (TPR) repeat protein